MEGHQYVIYKLTKLIECKTNYLELLFVQKCQKLFVQYDKDIRSMKESLKHKFEKTNRHIDESVFTVLNKGQRFEYDLEKLYKKLLKLFVQPHLTRIAKSLYLKEQPCNIMDFAQYNSPECKCVKNIIPCNLNANKVNKCCCLPKTLSRNYSEASSDGESFGYACREQKRWSKKHGDCAGRYQSPIAISTGKAIPLNLPAIDMIGYHNLLPAPIKLQNNGHSISLTVRKFDEKELELGEFMPYISGGKLDSQYELESLHFHWGDKNNRGAEHVLNDIRYAMEMHIVHRNKKYKDLTEALGYSDGVAVMAFFYQISEFEAPEIRNIAKNVHYVKNVNDIVELSVTFSLASLFEKIDLERYYTYKGSLTTPPCSEAVTWILFPDPLQISLSQITKFRHLHGIEEGSTLVDNFRALQPVENRRIFLRKVNTKGQPIDELDKVHYSKWDWFI